VLDITLCFVLISIITKQRLGESVASRQVGESVFQLSRLNIDQINFCPCDMFGLFLLILLLLQELVPKLVQFLVASS